VEINAGDNNTIYAITKEGGAFSAAVSYDGGETFETDPGFRKTSLTSAGA
jgi:hypothetical protein